MTLETQQVVTTERSSRAIVRALLRNKAAVFALVVLGIVLLAAIFADLIAPYDPNFQNLDVRRTGPSAAHWLGNDGLGRDILSRLIHGARATLLGGSIAVGVSMTVGVPLGLFAGFRGGFAESLIMRATDVLLAFPSFLLAIIIVAVLGPSLTNAAVAIGLAGIPTFARLVRGSVLSVRTEDYVLGAVAAGATSTRVMRRYVLPNVMAPIIVLATLSLATAILSIAGLSFLGLGAQPPLSEWGAMLRDGRDFLRQAPHITLFPGLAIMLVVVVWNLLGDALQDALNPRGE